MLKTVALAAHFRELDVPGPSDQRNARPRVGSALWWYVWAVASAGALTTVFAVAALHAHDVPLLTHSPAFWLVAAPMAVTALRPIVPNGPGGNGTFALVVFLMALMMRFGLPAAVILCAMTMLVRGALYRQALHRNLFNTAQHILTLVAAWGVLRAFAIDPSPSRPWNLSEPHIKASQLIAVALAGLAYLIVNNGSVYIAASMVDSQPIMTIVREDLRELAVVGVAMVSLAPLVLVVMVEVWPLVPLFYPALLSMYRNATVSEQHEHDALHDSLTGLGNRELLHREASKALDALPRLGGGLALSVLDLDRFKLVNDSRGHATGDRLLQIVAERLNAAVRAGDLIARLGGDEFVVLVRNVPDVATARGAAVRMLGRVDGLCDIDGVPVELAVSLGVALAPQHGSDFDALLRRADRAMYIAKAAGSGVAVFDPERDDDRHRRLPLLIGDELEPEGTPVELVT
jgi:diguanylate cyclase (GGDEF)-like protein